VQETALIIFSENWNRSGLLIFGDSGAKFRIIPAGHKNMPRLSYEDSCRQLESQQLLPPGDISTQPPQPGDGMAGVRFANVMLAGAKLSGLTLPHTYFSRSEIRASTFRNTGLTESTAHWNDFIEVDFSRADLSGSDLRACVFQRVNFRDAKLAGVDLRYCGFKHCDFTGADLTDAKLTPKAGQALRLSPEQQSVIVWQADDGEEPEG
jgi:uncharacterized protein YjbI with pentapeptide repeats